MKNETILKNSKTIDYDMFMKYVKEGLNQREISEKFGINRQTLRRWIDKYKIDVKFLRIDNKLNKKYGRLLVIENVGLNSDSKVLWKCLCDCGNYKTVVSSHLTDGSVQSCGCLFSQAIIISNKNRIKYQGEHSSWNERLYRTYSAMIRRCYNTESKDYKYYGGKGVVICKEWLDSFDCFYEWAMNNKYNEELSIDRIDVNGNYEANNCRWATAKEQMNNTTKTIRLEINGEYNTLSYFSEKYNIPRKTIYERYKYGKHKDNNLIRAVQ